MLYTSSTSRGGYILLTLLIFVTAIAIHMGIPQTVHEADSTASAKLPASQTVHDDELVGGSGNKCVCAIDQSTT